MACSPFEEQNTKKKLKKKACSPFNLQNTESCMFAILQSEHAEKVEKKGYVRQVK